MTSREKFEAWYLENWGCTEDNLDSLFEESPHGNEYYRFGVRLAWQAWQAATKQSEAKCAALAAEKEKFAVECAATKIAITYLKSGRQDFTLNTHATDAFLAEVRAQGVEMAACALDDVNQFNYANMLDDLAQKLRKGASL